jgi:copper resistance protein D
MELGAVVLRWLSLSALALVVGALVLEAVVMPGEEPALGVARRRLRRSVVGGVLLLMATTAGQLILRAQVMVGGSMFAAVSALPMVLLRTHFGIIWIIRGGLLAAVIIAALAPTRAARWSALALAAGVAATTSMTGHAGDWGDATPSAGIDLLHIWAASAWTGGLMALSLAVLVDTSEWPPSLFPRLARRFSTLAGWCLAIVIASGIYNAVIQVSTPAALVWTAYGRILVVKIFLVLALAACGAVSRYGIVAALGPGEATGVGSRLFRRAFPQLAHAKTRPAPVALSRYVASEALLALIVFGCTAMLGESTPARHAFKMQHGSTMSPADEDSSPATPPAHEKRH